ncbi:MAG: quinohemoprotein amine dehydrogenase subunit alpha [Emcibacter sp.]|nr:quinohemoprotein amine dehydrogenase subunit alpha [Emcibacter sp.]
MSGKRGLFISGLMLFVLSAVLTPVSADDSTNSIKGKALVNDYCAACHEQADKGLARISDVRKTPEGWDMTIFRMEHLHGLAVDSDDRFAIIKYLSAENGLSPKESAPFRFVLEQRAHFVDTAPNEDLDALCGRCHTNARYGLQRRTAEDWLKHMHFHVGQYPSLEYQARARDRFWWQEVTSKTYKELAELYPFQTADWDQWKAAAYKSPVGLWRVTGHRPGQGGYEGIMTVSRTGDFFKAEYDLNDMGQKGESITGNSKSVVYTGYEWRGSGILNGIETREVYALSEDGNRMTGRWHDAIHYDIGGEFQAVRMDGAETQVLTKSSDYIRQGETKKVSLHGTGLTGKVSADKGLGLSVIHQNSTSVTLQVTADKNAAPGSYGVTVGQAETAIVVYDKIDMVKITPEWTIARLGGGNSPAVSAQFEATAYMKGKTDEIKIGIMPALWQIKPFNADAKQMKDVDFAGRIDQSGRFMPAAAGPNPDRKYSTNNAGNLAIIGLIKDGDHQVSGKAQLIVTVQRWNLPPIR